MAQYLFIDFENVQKVRLDQSSGSFEKIYIFLGRSQNKLDFELVQRLQDLGPRVEWIKIGGEGKNNLDFHLAYMLGVMDSKTDRGTGFVVLSRDKGFDALLRFIHEKGRSCRRVDSLGKPLPVRRQTRPEPRRARKAPARRPQPARTSPASAGIEAKIFAALNRMPQQRRPVSRKSFLNYLENQHAAGKTAPPAAELLEKLLKTGRIYTEASRIKYRL